MKLPDKYRTMQDGLRYDHNQSDIRVATYRYGLVVLTRPSPDKWQWLAVYENSVTQGTAEFRDDAFAEACKELDQVFAKWSNT